MAPKRVLKCLSKQDKLRLIQDIESGSRNKDVACKYGVPKSTVSTILKNKQSIIAAFEADAAIGCSLRAKKQKFQKVNDAVIDWFTTAKSQNMPLTGSKVKDKAMEFAKRFSENDFKASTGWLYKWKRRHSAHQQVQLEQLKPLHQKPKIDIKKLISVVRDRECLWNQTDRCYCNTQEKKRKWQEVAKYFNVSEEEVRYKWRGLRDTFRRIVLKMVAVDSGTADTIPTSKWHYFDSMSFIQDQVLKRINKEHKSNTVENNTKLLRLKSMCANKPISIDNDCKQVDEETYFNISLYSESESELETTGEDCSNAETLQQTEIVKEEYADAQSDDDYHFVMSILPYIKRVPVQNKLSMRIKILKTINEHRQQTCPEVSRMVIASKSQRDLSDNKQ